jgi:hypothetical protein
MIVKKYQELEEMERRPVAWKLEEGSLRSDCHWTGIRWAHLTWATEGIGGIVSVFEFVGNSCHVIDIAQGSRQEDIQTSNQISCGCPVDRNQYL